MLREVIIAILLCCLVIPGCTASQNIGNDNLPITRTTELTYEQPASFSEENTPITVKLTLTKIFVVNEETTFRVEVTSIFDAYGTNVKVILPADGELISGTIDKKIDLKANTSESFESKIKFSRSGDFKIIVKALKVIDKENSWGDMDVHYMTVNDGISKLSSAKPVIYAQLEQSGLIGRAHV